MRAVTNLILALALGGFLAGCIGAQMMASARMSSPGVGVSEALDTEIYQHYGLPAVTPILDAQAIVEHTKTFEADPRHAGAFINRANARSAIGLDDIAIPDYTQALLLDPQATDAYVGLARIHLKRGQFALAMAEFTLGLEPCRYLCRPGSCPFEARTLR